VPKNKFEMLKDRVIQRGEGSGREIVKDRKEILKEEREKKTKKEKKERKKDEGSKEGPRENRRNRGKEDKRR